MSDPTIADLLQGPNKTAVVRDAENTWTRAELRSAVGRISGALRARGIGPGDRVAVTTRNSVPGLAALLGARAVGALVCPLDAGRLSTLSTFKPRLVIVDSNREVTAAVQLSELLSHAGSEEPRLPEPSEFAWAIPTSGSFGSSRIVVFTAADVASFTETISAIIGFGPSDTILSPLPFHHVYGLSQIWLVLRSGASLVIPPHPLLPVNLMRWMESCSVLSVLPHSLRPLLDLDLPFAPRLVTLAGEPTWPEDRLRFSKKLPATRFYQFYGLTEAPRCLWLSNEEFFGRPEATGRPIPGTQAWLSSEGELMIEGGNVSTGYLDDPVQTAARFPSARRLRTGDIFTESDGFFRYMGRLDGMFKVSGEKVIPEIVEAALNGTGEVERALVASEIDTDNQCRVVAWVVPKHANVSPRVLLQRIRAIVPPVMLPSRIEVVPELALTPNGKLLRRRGSSTDLGSNQ